MKGGLVKCEAAPVHSGGEYAAVVVAMLCPLCDVRETLALCGKCAEIYASGALCGMCGLSVLQDTLPLGQG